MAREGLLFSKEDLPAIFLIAKAFLLLCVITLFLKLGGLIIALFIRLELMYKIASISVPISAIILFFLIKYKPRRKAKGDDGIILQNTKNKEIRIVNPYRGIFICSGAGGGKSKSVIEPILHQMVQSNYAGIVYDYKYPCLTNEILGAYNSLHRKVVKPVILNLDNPCQSFRINPLSSIPNRLFANEYAKTLYSNLNPSTIRKTDFWDMSAQALLAGGIWYMYNQHREICTIPHVIKLLLWDDPEELSLKLASDPEAADLTSSFRAGLQSEKQTAGVLSTLQNTLIPLTDQNLTYILTGNDFNLDINNPIDPKLLIIGSNPVTQSYLSAIISLVITSALKLMNQQNKVKSLLVLDEAPTLYIPDLETIPATSRSNKLATVFCAQDYSQIELMYGPKKAEILLSNLANQFWGSTSNLNTSRKIIEKFGKEEILIASHSKGQSSRFGERSYNSSKSYSNQLRDRIRTQDIFNMQPGQFYCQLVESDKNEYLKTQLKPGISKTKKTIGDFRLVSNDDIQAQVDKVNNDIKGIFSNE